MDVDERYKLETSLYDTIDSLADVSNVSEVTNADFSALSGQGQSPTTESDGDDFEFVDNWFIVGATQATYSIVAQDYPDNSEIQSKSNYFLDIDISTYTGSGLYFYQRRSDGVRYLQNRVITFTVIATNNLTDDVKLRGAVVFDYAGTSDILEERPMYFSSGENEISISVTTPSLRNKTVNPGSFVEFRLSFENLLGGVADLDLHQIKVEIGKLSTQYTQ
jgi:hypothetical protein